MSSPDRVEKHAIVTMQYSLVTDTGVVIREAGGDPVRYIQGCGALFPRLEATLDGHRVGDVVSARLLPGDAFGKRDVDPLHEVPLSELPPGENITPGGQLTGEKEAGEQVTFRITEVTDEIVKLDGNHPLAGQTLVFEVETQGLDQATAAEIRNGKISDTWHWRSQLPCSKYLRKPQASKRQGKSRLGAFYAEQSPMIRKYYSALRN